MSRLFAIIFFSLFIFHKTSAQQNEIDSLKNLLPVQHDTSRINCLNELAKAYQKNYQTDSALFYSSLVINEANKINYNRGEAIGLFVAGNTSLVQGDYKSAELYFQPCINKYKKQFDEDKLGWCYFGLASSLCLQGYFEAATQAFNISNTIFVKTKDLEGSSNATFFLAYNYEAYGIYDKAFDLCYKSLEQSRRIKNEIIFSYSLLNIGNLFRNVEDYQTALTYYRQANNWAEKYHLNWSSQSYIGEIYCLMGKFDSSQYYFNQELKFLKINNGDSNAKKEPLMSVMVGMGELYLRQGNYNKALANFLEPLKFYEWGNNNIELMKVLIDIGEVYKNEKHYAAALEYAQKALIKAKESGARKFIRDGTNLMWKIYDNMQIIDSAYKYSLQYAGMKDSLLNIRYVRQLSLFKQQLENEKEQLQTQLILQKEILTRKIAVSITFIILLLAFIIIRIVVSKRKNEKLESEKTQADLQSIASELEMQTLRSQMNPHFIFNCLSSINSFILKNKTDEASNYLTKFSRLIRMVLNHSRQSFISLEDELETLRLYLEMERLRFKNSFDFCFTYTNAVDVFSIHIPPLLLQPFAENAIWHGLMQKQEKGFLNFEFSSEENFLYCIITDNGIGRKQAALLKSKSAEKQKSMGLKITTERLSLLNSNSNNQTFFTIEDLIGEDGNATGTRVHLKIFYKEMIEV